MAKKYLSYEGLTEYDALIKATIAEGDSDALAEAKIYADNAANTVKNDLLNGAGEAYDTLKELGDLINENVDAIEALNTVASGKADKEHTHDDFYYTKSEIDTHINNKENPHEVTAEQVGAATVEYVDSLTKVYAQPNEPTNPKEGDIWIDTDEAVVSYAEGESF